MISDTLNTLVSVPYLALTPELTQDYDGLNIGILRIFGKQRVVFGTLNFNGHRTQVDPGNFMNAFENPGAAIHDDFGWGIGFGAQSSRADKSAVGKERAAWLPFTKMSPC